MATYTDNYKLVKPQPYDYYDVRVGNRNLDAIDGVMAELRGENERLREELAGKADAGAIPDYNLPLDFGLDGTIKYRKNPFSEVSIHIAIRKSGTSDDIESGICLGTLPDGYRPSGAMTVPCYAACGEDGYTKFMANINIDTDGTMVVHTNESNSVRFATANFSFKAAQ